MNERVQTNYIQLSEYKSIETNFLIYGEKEKRLMQWPIFCCVKRIGIL